MTDANDVLRAHGSAGLRVAYDAALKKSIEQPQGDPDLVRLNEQFCVVRVGGKTRVLEFQPSPARRDALVPVYSSFADFKAFHDRDKKEVSDKNGTRKVGLGTWWIDHPQRRQYSAVVFEPGASEAQTRGKLNLWRGFSVQAEEGDCSLYLEHITNNVCAGNAGHAAYLLNWMAWAAQTPGRAAEVAVILRGREGTGKGIAAKYFGELFGSHFLHVSQAKHLVGNFNAHLQACSVLFADEALFAGDRSHEGVLKALISEPTLAVEPKGLDVIQVRNCLHIIMSSNEAWVIPAGADARRYLVLDVAETRKQDTSYFGALARQMENGGRAALLHFLLSRDLSRFNIRDVPKTEALADQKARSRRGVDLLVELLASEGVLPAAKMGKPHIAITTGEKDGTGFYAAARRLVPDLKRVSSIVVKTTLRKHWGCKDWREAHQRGIEFPTLAELREMFDRKHGKQEWPEADEWSEDVPESKPVTARQSLDVDGYR